MQETEVKRKPGSYLVDYSIFMEDCVVILETGIRMLTAYQREWQGSPERRQSPTSPDTDSSTATAFVRSSRVRKVSPAC